MSDQSAIPPSNNTAAQALDMERRMAELGQRYLDRTASEIEELKSMVARITQGDDSAIKNIEIMSHRIRGSGAMFGFDLVSDVAGEIELLAVDTKVGLPHDRAALQMRFAALLRVLAFVLAAARK